LNLPTKRILFWTPRLLCILYAGFIILFALDVFNEGYGVWDTAIALLIHLIPTALILLILAVSWRWEWVGTVLFGGMGLFYLFTTLDHPDWILWISGPLFLIAVLFLLNWLHRRDLRAGT